MMKSFETNFYVDEFEAGRGYASARWSKLPLVKTTIHSSFSEARENALQLLGDEMKAFVAYKKNKLAKEELTEEDEFYLERYDCSGVDNPSKSRFDVKIGFRGNAIGPCFCIEDGFKIRCTILQKE